jgi:hypothetical protein
VPRLGHKQTPEHRAKIGASLRRRESPKARRQRELREKWAQFDKLDSSLQILGTEQVARDIIVKTNVGHFRVHRKGHITGPFPGEPLKFTRAAILYIRTHTHRWESRARRTDLNCANFPIGRTWSLRLTRIRTAALGRDCSSRKRGLFTPEHRAKLSAAHLGKKLSPETRAKIGAGNKGKNSGRYVGRKMSPEWRENLRQSILFAWRRKRILASAQVEQPATYRDTSSL